LHYVLSYGVEQRFPLESGSNFYVAIDGSLRFDFSSSPTPSRENNIEAYVLSTLRAGWRDDRFEIFGWVRIAFDTQYFDFLTAAPG
jgi:iron complex outermembrane receptor protein